MNRFVEAGQQLAAATHSTAGVFDWIKNNVVGLVLLGVGVLILVMAKKKNVSDVIAVVVVVIIGLMVVGLASNGNGASFGAWVAHKLFG